MKRRTRSSCSAGAAGSIAALLLSLPSAAGAQSLDSKHAAALVAGENTGTVDSMVGPQALDCQAARNTGGTPARYACGMMQNRINVRFAALLLPAILLTLAPAARAATNEGGSQQVGAQTGCMNKWMFDGMWRVRVTKVVYAPATATDVNGWEVTMQWGNGTTIASLTPGDSLKGDLVIALKNGDTLSATDTTSGTLTEQQLDAHSFPASGQFTFTQPFRSSSALDQSNPPAKLLIAFDVAKYRSYHPNGSGALWRQKTVSPNFRIDLTCGA